ncbi:MAG TPA: hypothetical protein PK402_02455 [Tepidisphaeraceae bacterium]|nr:hypothetical protein [Tepidisphaeraceae bacterium]
MDTGTGMMILDTGELTPELLARYPIWMDGHWFDREVLAERYNVLAIKIHGCTRVAYTGALPYPLLDEDDDHPSYVDVRCTATAAAGNQYDGFLTPMENVRHMDITVFSPHGARFNGQMPMKLGEIPLERYELVVPRWRNNVEAAFGRTLSELFPMTLSVDPKLLPPGVTTTWTLPGLIYYENGEQRVVPLG